VYSLEKIFTIAASIFGCLLILITPPFQGADEYLHFYRAFQISEGQFIPQRQNGDCHGYSRNFTDTLCLGGMLPESLLTTVRNVSPIDLRFHPDRKQNPHAILALLDLPLAPTDRLFLKFNTTGLHAPIPYLPQAIGIALGRIFHLSPLGLMYAGRLANLGTWIFASFWAIRWFPSQKLSLFLLCLMPMSMFQAASLSADVMTNSLAILLVSIVVKLKAGSRTPIAKITGLGIIAIALLLSVSKLAYFPLLALLFLVPPRQFKGNFRYSVSLFVAFTISAIAAIAWSSIVKQIYVPLAADILPDRQLAFIFDRPLRFSSILGQTFYQEGLSYLQQFIGVLGWFDTPLPTWHVLSYWGILLATSLYSVPSKLALSVRQKWGILLLLILNAIGLCTLAYLWNPVGAKTVGGLQGRYFIPFALPFILLFYHPNFKDKLNRIRTGVICYSILSAIVTLFVVWNRYYG
jgi:uncharacterized membrane protein